MSLRYSKAYFFLWVMVDIVDLGASKKKKYTSPSSFPFISMILYTHFSHLLTFLNYRSSQSQKCVIAQLLSFFFLSSDTIDGILELMRYIILNKKLDCLLIWCGSTTKLHHLWYYFYTHFSVHIKQDGFKTKIWGFNLTNYLLSVFLFSLLYLLYDTSIHHHLKI